MSHSFTSQDYTYMTNLLRLQEMQATGFDYNIFNDANMQQTAFDLSVRHTVQDMDLCTGQIQDSPNVFTYPDQHFPFTSSPIVPPPMTEHRETYKYVDGALDLTMPKQPRGRLPGYSEPHTTFQNAASSYPVPPPAHQHVGFRSHNSYIPCQSPPVYTMPSHMPSHNSHIPCLSQPSPTMPSQSILNSQCQPQVSHVEHNVKPMPDCLSTPPGRPFKSHNPSYFNGESCEWMDYEEEFKTTAEWNKWSYREMGLQLKLHLRGNALKVLRDMPEDRKVDYISLSTALRNRFDPSERRLTHKVNFRSRVKKPSETAADFGHELINLVSKAFPTISGEEREELLLDQYFQGLKQEERMQEHVMLGHPANLHKAIQIATEYESLVQSRQKPLRKPVEISRVFTDNESKGKTKPTHNNKSSNLTKTPNGPTLKDFETLQSKFDSLSKQLEQLKVKNDNTGSKQSGRYKPRYRSGTGCYSCGEQGHFAVNCPKSTQNFH